MFPELEESEMPEKKEERPRRDGTDERFRTAWIIHRNKRQKMDEELLHGSTWSDELLEHANAAACAETHEELTERLRTLANFTSDWRGQLADRTEILPGLRHVGS